MTWPGYPAWPALVARRLWFFYHSKSSTFTSLGCQLAQCQQAPSCTCSSWVLPDMSCSPGTMYTRLLVPAYTAVRDEFRRRLRNANVTSLGGFDTCYTVPIIVPAMTLIFEGMKVTLPVENLLIQRVLIDVPNSRLGVARETCNWNDAPFVASAVLSLTSKEKRKLSGKWWAGGLPNQGEKTDRDGHEGGMGKEGDHRFSPRVFLWWVFVPGYNQPMGLKLLTWWGFESDSQPPLLYPHLQPTAPPLSFLPFLCLFLLPYQATVEVPHPSPFTTARRLIEIIATRIHPMDGYYGRGIVLLPVPHDQELSDRLPSPNSWSRWGVLGSGALGEENMLPDDGSNGGACGARLGVRQDDCRFDVCLSLRDEYRPGFGHLPGAPSSVYLHRNSSLDDLQSAVNGRQHGPLCLCSQCDRDVIPYGDSWFDLISSPGLHMSAEMSAEFEEQSLSESRDLDDGGYATPAVPLNMKGYQPLQDSRPYNGEIVPSGQFGQQHYPDISESSPEELALEELQMVMALLSDRTRICLRDGLYRLADNSKQRLIREDGQERGSSIRKPPLTRADKRFPEGANESKTNVIDRAIANIMFNRMDSWSQEDHYSASAHAGSNPVNLCACVAPCSPDWNLPAICLDENEYQFSQEFEVPGLSEEAMAE